MKARIKATGEVVDVYHEPQHGQTTIIYKESVFVNSRMWSEDEIEILKPQPKQDWSNEDKKIMEALIGYFSIGANNNETTCNIEDKKILAWLNSLKQRIRG